MGRKKIAIKNIEDKEKRNVTFHKRKIGLLKKAYQLSQLCNLQVYLVFNDPQGNIINFRTDDISILEQPQHKKFQLTPNDYPKFVTRNKHCLKIETICLNPPPSSQIFQELIEEPLLSKYSIRSNVFFPQPRMKPG